MRINATALMVLLFAVSTAQGFSTPGTIMAEHVGDNDPATEMAAYWRAETHPFYTWREDADPIPGDVGPDPGPPANWSMVENDKIARYWSNQVHHPGDSAPYDYHQFLDPSGWVATILVKVNSSHSKNHAAIFNLEDTVSVIDLHIINNPSNPPGNGLKLRDSTGEYDPAIHPTTASDWTLINIVCDAQGNTNPADDVFTIYVDGNLVNTYSRSYFQSNVMASGGNFTFGRLTPTNTGLDADQQYALWRLEFGNDLPFPVAGDVDGDLWVGNKDLNLLIENWGSTTFPEGDLDNSGTIDMGDYLLVVNNWGTGIIPPAGIPVSKLMPTGLPDGTESNTASLGFLLGGVLLRPARRRRSKKSLLCLLLVTFVVFRGAPTLAQSFTWAPIPGGMGGSSTSFGDYNNDGLVDIYAGQRLLRNDGGSWTGVANPPVDNQLVHTVWGDYDNDGYLDLYSQVENIMYRNTYATTPDTFDDTAITMPTLSSQGGSSVAASFADFDNNGFIDLYIAAHTFGGSSEPDTLMMNSGSGSTPFAITGEEGSLGDAIPVSTTYQGRGATSCDFDKDGDQDIYVSNYGGAHPNYLWINDGTGNFTESASTYGALGGNTWTPSSNWGDFDNDGEFDLFVCNFNHTGAGGEPPVQFLKNGGSPNYHFSNQGAGGVTTGREWVSSAAADYDNDGDLDLFVSTFQAGDKAALYTNDGSGTFTFTGTDFEEGTQSYQTAWADIDNDGDLDLTTDGAPLINNLNNGNHWLKVKLIGNGTTVNSAAIGTQVRIEIDPNNTDPNDVIDFFVTRQVEGGTGVRGNQNDLTLHFGLGKDSGPVDLEICWPDGRTRTVSDVAVDQTLVWNDTISLDMVEVAGAPAGYTAYDLKTNIATLMGPLELVVNAVDPNKDGIYHVSQADAPDEAAAAIDTYVTIGTLENVTGPNPDGTFVIGHAEAIDPLSTSMVFDEEDINIAWAWDPSDVLNYRDFSTFAIDYDNGQVGLNELLALVSQWLAGEAVGPGESFHVARIVLSDDAAVSLTLVGMRTGTQAFTILSETLSP